MLRGDQAAVVSSGKQGSLDLQASPAGRGAGPARTVPVGASEQPMCNRRSKGICMRRRLTHLTCGLPGRKLRWPSEEMKLDRVRRRRLGSWARCSRPASPTAVCSSTISCTCANRRLHSLHAACMQAEAGQLHGKVMQARVGWANPYTPRKMQQPAASKPCPAVCTGTFPGLACSCLQRSATERTPTSFTPPQWRSTRRRRRGQPCRHTGSGS